TPTNQIDSAYKKWIESQQPPASHQAPTKSSISFHFFHRVLRAAGHVAASGRKNWRDGPLISAKQLQPERVEDPVHVGEISLSRQREIARRLLPSATTELKSLRLTRVKTNF